MMLRHVLLIFLWIFLNILTLNGLSIECDVQERYKWLCENLHVNLSREDTLDPAHDNPTEIISLEVEGTIPALRGNFCEVFPRLDKMTAINVGMEEISENVFSKCSKIEWLDLSKNNIKVLYETSFKGLPRLKYAFFFNSSWPIADLDLSDSPNLQLLDLSYSKIVSIPLETLRKIVTRNLKSLFLDSNNLFDLNIEKILELSPKLRIIRIMDNYFKCSRLERMVTNLQFRRVSWDMNYYSNYRRERTDTTENIGGIDCLSDEIWETERVKYISDSTVNQVEVNEDKTVKNGDKNQVEVEDDKTVLQRLTAVEIKVNVLIEFLEKQFSTKLIEANQNFTKHS